ncbi:YggS family pyridoxal phosphate-dependent enzyme [Paenibacillus sp. NEAU-GSW1]|uniref:YggS family pyridoxal phosphate-dependent enzyme n=1 Tax=Paenibacillus sp. NEAU-GSW1 TaxID=2682486 RepID=UPI0012E16C0E|nr:YggS family pyridoxal phosphate-dependent enzyme [Paenibacillus sp. NEAU-GSW1]MUT66178.1 YggS family pyridoxal phosphate-dependent enzyme [Paenibacillus sp. NEAU-GSW1]
MELTTFKDRIQEVDSRIAAACERSGRSREDVNVIAVTKYVSLETAIEAHRLGLQHLGENRWQDAQQKWEAISGSGNDSEDAEGQAVWHFIGSLQTNKVKDVIGKFTYIHSLDRISLAQAIDKRASQLAIKVPCFIQVNISGEDSKHGMPPEAVTQFAEELRQYPNLLPIGLMTMAPYDSEPEAARPVFRALRELRDQLNLAKAFDPPLTELSMGMSGDFEVAIEEGATWVRLGTILVGKEG